MENTSLSTVLVTQFDHLTANEHHAISDAQMTADATGTPCGVWHRDGWFAVCDLAPEMIEPQPELSGWALWAVTDPTND